MSVSAIIVTRGNVALDSIIASIPNEWELLIWNNGGKECLLWDFDHGMRIPWMRESAQDLSVYGRYAAIEHATHDLIYVQDDDCIVSDPKAIVDEWTRVEVKGTGHGTRESPWLPTEDHVVCNMPQEFRQDFYKEHALVGFGAAFHRDAPQRAFIEYERARGMDEMLGAPGEFFRRTCDVVFTGLTPRVLVDVPYSNLAWADSPDRMYRQPTHVEERTKMLELVRQVSLESPHPTRR